MRPRLTLGAVALCGSLAAASPEPSTYTLTAPAVTTSFPDPSTEPSWTRDDEFQQSVLNSTNLFRRQHDAKPLVWNTRLADYARDYLSDNNDCKFEHSGGEFGENLAMGSGFATPAAAVDAWGNERRGYSWDRPRFSTFTGHFTQLVWKNTTDVGCARRLCGKLNGFFLVCEYYPPGNVGGQYEEMVGRQVEGLGGGHRGSTPDLVVMAGAMVVWLSWVLLV